MNHIVQICRMSLVSRQGHWILKYNFTLQSHDTSMQYATSGTLLVTCLYIFRWSSLLMDVKFSPNSFFISSPYRIKQMLLYFGGGFRGVLFCCSRYASETLITFWFWGRMIGKGFMLLINLHRWLFLFTKWLAKCL